MVELKYSHDPKGYRDVKLNIHRATTRDIAPDRLFRREGLGCKIA